LQEESMQAQTTALLHHKVNAGILWDESYLFNDVFTQRADYSSGDFYRLKRSYLKSRGDTIEPPDQFKTKRQMRMKKKKEELVLNGIESSAFINVLKKDHDEVARNPYVEKKLKTKSNNTKNVSSKKKEKVLLLAEYTSMRPEDWVEEIQAGCRLWVNPNTGEVANVCPFNKEKEKPPVKLSKWAKLGAPAKERELAPALVIVRPKTPKTPNYGGTPRGIDM
jgi:hypothetical protein